MSGRSFEADEGQVPAVCDEGEREFGAGAAMAANWGLRIGAGTCTRPTWPRFVARLGISRLAPEVDLVRSAATESNMWPVTVVPVEIELQLRGHGIVVERDQRQFADTFRLQRLNEAPVALMGVWARSG